MKTYTYKRVGDLEIKADVHRAGDTVVRPVVVYIHGGALMGGHRGGMDERAKKMLLGAGYALVSIDYRLAPETKLPGIVEDLEDAFAWVRAEGPKLFHVDTSRIAVWGGSAGGYLALAAGFRVQPRPAVLVSFYGYGHLIGDWYSRPSPHQRHRTQMGEDEARRQVAGPPIADPREKAGERFEFYRYCRLHGLWPKEVSTWDPHAEPHKFYPYMPVRNVTNEYPPTMLIHGTADTDVPYEQSVLMAKELERHGVEHELVTIPGAEHGLADGDPKEIDAAYAAALAFVDRHSTL
jgi:acetyl esterase/lipase